MPTTIYLSKVNQLEGLDMRAQTFKLETLVRVFWHDTRLAYGDTATIGPPAPAPRPTDRAPIAPLSTQPPSRPLVHRPRVHPARRTGQHQLWSRAWQRYLEA